jgi:hypothetical protein
MRAPTIACPDAPDKPDVYLDRAFAIVIFFMGISIALCLRSLAANSEATHPLIKRE